MFNKEKKNKMKIIVMSLLFISIILSCEKADEVVVSQPQKRDYQTQYNEEIVKIENYLKTHSISVVNNPGFADDQSATFAITPSLDANSIWGSDPTIPKASLKSKLVTVGGVLHKIYYIKFRDGIGSSPVRDSKIRAHYKGFLLTQENGFFDQSPDNGTKFALNQLILGWREILPEFKMGNVTGNNQYTDFGAGVMFLPSALAFYEIQVNNIPSYSPLAFTIKLFNVI